ARIPVPRRPVPILLRNTPSQVSRLAGRRLDRARVPPRRLRASRPRRTTRTKKNITEKKSLTNESGPRDARAGLIVITHPNHINYSSLIFSPSHRYAVSGDLRAVQSVLSFFAACPVKFSLPAYPCWA